MKKKPNIREQREARKAAQKQKFSSQPQQEAPAAQPVPAAPAAAAPAEKPIKSRNKAAGLKATIVSGSTLCLTSFGRGNAAVPESTRKRQSRSSASSAPA